MPNAVDNVRDGKTRVSGVAPRLRRRGKSKAKLAAAKRTRCLRRVDAFAHPRARLAFTKSATGDVMGWSVVHRRANTYEASRLESDRKASLGGSTVELGTKEYEIMTLMLCARVVCCRPRVTEGTHIAFGRSRRGILGPPPQCR